MEEERSNRRLPYEEDVFAGHNDGFEASAIKIEYDDDPDVNPVLIPNVFSKETAVVKIEYDSDIESYNENKTKEESANVRQLIVLCTRVLPLKCDVCEKIFATLSSLNRHKQSHGLPNRCEMELSIKFEPDEYKAKSNMSKYLQCGICPYTTFHKGHLNEHLKTHSPSKFKCDVCSFASKYKTSLDRHKLIHQSSSTNRLKCRRTRIRSGMEPSTRIETEQNQDSKRTPLSTKALPDEQKTKPYIQETILIFRCRVCPYTALKKRYMTRHLAKHSSKASFKFIAKNSDKLFGKGYWICSICKKRFPSKRLLDEHKTRPNIHKSFIRQKSDMKLIHKEHFPNKSLLDEHKSIPDVHANYRNLKKHSSNTTIKCDVCGKFTSKILLDEHKKSHSTSTTEGEYKCDICEYRSNSMNCLNHHMLVHSEDRPFVCEICNKAFKEPSTLRRHMWTHVNKRFQCDICQKYFVEKSSVRRHISTIHADFKPGQPKVGPHAKQFGCKRCGKFFKSQTKFKMHAEMHGNPNFECEICGHVYAGRSHLRIHQRIHTGEKPFVCTICNQKFAFRHVLKLHQARIHQKINKFKCNLCSLTFVKKSDLSSHASCHIFNLKKNYNGTRKIPKENSTKNENHNAVNGLFGQLIDVPPDPMETAEDIREM